MGHGEDPPQGKPSQHTSRGGAGKGECVCVTIRVVIVCVAPYLQFY